MLALSVFKNFQISDIYVVVLSIIAVTCFAFSFINKVIFKSILLFMTGVINLVGCISLFVDSKFSILLTIFYISLGTSLILFSLIIGEKKFTSQKNFRFFLFPSVFFIFPIFTISTKESISKEIAPFFVSYGITTCTMFLFLLITIAFAGISFQLKKS